jgi:hypothetical protein
VGASIVVIWEIPVLLKRQLELRRRSSGLDRWRIIYFQF